MKTLTVSLPGRSYDILIERGLLDRAGEHCRAVLPRASKLFVVTDSTVGPLYGARLERSLTAAGFSVTVHTVPAGESAKCAARLAQLWEAMMGFGLTRTDAVVALGGGVVGDLAGFAAATVLRGVDFIQIPTTLLSQVDSSVGGKVAIDLDHGKNLAGAFWQPRLVLMDPDTLDTLPDATFADGMAEVVKYGCIFDRPFFDFLAARPSRAQLMGEIEHILYTCCDLKRMVVEQDERDTGKRMLLNFGHTLGHAYELAGHYETWTHGQAVAAGMVRAAKLGEKLGITPAGTAEAIVKVLTPLGLPVEISCTAGEYTAAIGLDKKGAGADISVILLEELGRAVPHKMPKADLLEELK
ncbi:3-dehydroquinate synthase [Intestinimonas massiliensis (ex Afouda et al. 2020)]|uniref:3-dehydroquinate synthase n=1 Tax=Intestinimonas massiliensis (ex Afouda et al. 2020) TaxID=1673721 RepID=UPI00102FEF4D|nr:3-dehydroquinate synthase [Intestinimonas massiliensis (ex Afouda et al. 2020)]